MMLPVPDLIDCCPNCGESDQPFELSLSSTSKPWECKNCTVKFRTRRIAKNLPVEESEADTEDWNLIYD